MTTIRIGTRGSKLALWQATWVETQLKAAHPGIEVTTEIIHTKGDKILDTPLALVGGKGLFVKEIEEALLDGRVDIAVHSMKDVPTELPDGLFISTICKREDPRDAFVGRTVQSFDALPNGAKVGTSSLRRQSQLLHRRPDLTIVSLRGNVQTRLRKLTDEGLDAIILAAAGLIRMEATDQISEYMSHTDSLPAVAQGAVGIEARIDDTATLALLTPLHHSESAVAVETERAFLARLEGGCQVPIAAHATINDQKIILEGLVGAVDGSTLYREKATASSCDRTALGVSLAEKILGLGGGALLDEAYQKGEK